MKTAIPSKQQSEYLAALFGSMQEAVVATGNDLSVEYWNKGAGQLFGYETGNGHADIFLGEDRGKALGTLRRTGLWKSKVHHRTPAGDTLLLDASVTPVKGKDNNVTGYVGVYRDITEYNQKEHNLTTLFSLLSSLDDDVFVIDRAGRLEFIGDICNKTIESIHGIRFQPHDNILDKLPDVRRQQVREYIQRALAGERCTYEVQLQNQAGEPIWFQGNVFPIRDRDGAITHACLLGRNVTAQKEMEQLGQKLYRSRKIFETFMENSPIPSWIANVAGKLRYVNPAYLKTFGLQKDDVGKLVQDLFPEAIAQMLREHDEEIMQEKKPVHALKKVILPDGKEHIYEIFKFPVFSETKTYIGGWAIDVTEETLLKETLSRSLERLQYSEKALLEALAKEHQLNDMKSRFVSMASHEFRTPLSTMLSSAFLLEKYTTTEQQAHRQKHVRLIKESIQHLNFLLEDFLSLGKLEEGKTTVQPYDYNVKVQVQDVVTELESLKKKGQNVLYGHEGPEEFRTDKKLVRNILVNFLSNALKFSGENKKISVHTAVTQKGLTVRVKDEGIGISEADQAHLFETFFRGKNAQNIQGTGLGLHIVKRYAQLLGGDIRIQSVLGKGTEATFTLPVK